MNGRPATIDASKVSPVLRSSEKRATARSRLGAFLGGNLGYITNEGTGRKMVANGRLDQPCDPSSISGAAVPRAR